MSYVRNINIRFIGFAILCVLIFGYAYFQMHNLLTGPVITIESPSNGSVFPTAQTKILGATQNIASITLNGRQIFINEAGAFEEKLILSPGYNIITLHAEDKFGRETIETLELIYN